MNKTSTQSNLPAKERWETLLSQRSNEEVLEADAQMLMFQFLSELQKHQELQGITRKELAEKTGTSAGYLTQIWRGDKPLSFLMLAKMQQALGISFKIIAHPVNLPARNETF